MAIITFYLHPSVISCDTVLPVSFGWVPNLEGFRWSRSLYLYPRLCNEVKSFGGLCVYLRPAKRVTSSCNSSATVSNPNRIKAWISATRVSSALSSSLRGVCGVIYVCWLALTFVGNSHAPKEASQPSPTTGTKVNTSIPIAHYSNHMSKNDCPIRLRLQIWKLLENTNGTAPFSVAGTTAEYRRFSGQVTGKANYL